MGRVLVAVGTLVIVLSAATAWAEGPSSEPSAAQNTSAQTATPDRAPATPPPREPEVVIRTDTPYGEWDDGKTSDAQSDQAGKPPVVVLRGEQLQWYQRLSELAVGPLSSNSMDDFRAGEKQLLSITDPQALEPMALALYTPNTRWRSAFVQAARQYAESGVEPANKIATVYLSDMAVLDSSVILRGKARAALMSQKTPRLTDRLKFQLAYSPLDEVRTRAASLLSELKDRSAIAGMIEMLTTEEWRIVGADIETRSVQMDVNAAHSGLSAMNQIPIQAAVPGATATGIIMLPTVRVTQARTTVMAPAGGRIDYDIRKVTVAHRGILTALQQMTGKDFGFDKGAWRQWLDASEGGGSSRPAERNPYGIEWGD